MSGSTKSMTFLRRNLRDNVVLPVGVLLMVLRMSTLYTPGPQPLSPSRSVVRAGRGCNPVAPPARCAARLARTDAGIRVPRCLSSRGTESPAETVQYIACAARLCLRCTRCSSSTVHALVLTSLMPSSCVAHGEELAAARHHGFGEVLVVGVNVLRALEVDFVATASGLLANSGLILWIETLAVRCCSRTLQKCR